jgi:hypothetical protein
MSASGLVKSPTPQKIRPPRFAREDFDLKSMIFLKPKPPIFRAKKIVDDQRHPYRRININYGT